MATVWRLTARCHPKIGNFNQITRNLSTKYSQKLPVNGNLKYLYIIGGGLLTYSVIKWKNLSTIHALNLRKDKVRPSFLDSYNCLHFMFHSFIRYLMLRERDEYI